VNSLDSRLPADEVTLAERLAESRYLSAAFSANLLLSAPLGYGQGFTGFFPTVSRRKVTADRLGRKSLLWLDQAWNRNARRPLFLYYQLMETHSPYEPADEPQRKRAADAALRARLGLAAAPAARAAAVNDRLVSLRWGELSPDDVALLESLYDAEVALLDARLAWLFDELARRGVLERALVVFTADHGEEFREHGQLLHGTSLFEELIRVPLIVVGAGWPAGRLVEDRVSLVDVGPTLLAEVGLPAEPRFEGRSLRPLRDGARAPVDLLAEQPPNTRAPDLGRHRLAFLHGPVKLLVPRGEARPLLYDLDLDPGERAPDPAPLAAIAAATRAAAERTLAALEARAGTPERAAMDEATRARLRALGYAN
jgi:arylsulfatase A-like enzyme